ncbi:MAG TPA: hypothetical protein VFL86_27380 [Burkholderiaceae bacterium]|nr:hypothetical protein [Burkholderiaceae bacterium]
MNFTQGASAPSGDYPVVYRNLMAVGLLGSIYRCASDADIVNEAVELTLADPGLYRLYRSIAMGLGGNTDYAKRHLIAQAEEDDEADAAKMALAVSLLLGGDPDWRRWLDNVLATSSDQKARAAAHELLNYLHGLQRLS